MIFVAASSIVMAGLVPAIHGLTPEGRGSPAKTEAVASASLRRRRPKAAFARG
jgi:hypothetical protein